eukprot:CAMPEP_0179110052 /NCGR_PEP_ID=MMETSP0796-20121207/51344_1 /TAXON_ID=73915 /ORGANISM="Pyrodinium bahamense, Strain pbaha01" /LENGTH=64 /DNA_ID=CAMNT_0020808177 /DNA_START=28 /DNA_END=219 /DNA_ORIENTATION=+
MTGHKCDQMHLRCMAGHTSTLATGRPCVLHQGTRGAQLPRLCLQGPPADKMHGAEVFGTVRIFR